MKLINMNCPNCGAQMELDDEKKHAICSFCGTNVLIDDEVQHIKYDNAEETGYSFEKGRQRAQEELESKKNDYHMDYSYGLDNQSTNDNNFNGKVVQHKIKGDKDGLSSLIIGIIFNVVNCVMLFLPVYLFGGIFIIFPLVGFVKGINGIKSGGLQLVLGIFGIVLNIIAFLGALGFVIIGILSKLGIIK